MKQIAIQDANILIDLVKIGLFDHCLALPFQFTTTDIILNELYDEQVALIQAHITSGKFVVIEIPDEELIEILEMSGEDTRLSGQDWSALYYSKRMSALLLTGDRRLKTIAEAKGITVCGIFWLLDQLVNDKILSKPEACNYLESLMTKNKRLPIKEYDQRMKLWGNK